MRPRTPRRSAAPIKFPARWKAVFLERQCVSDLIWHSLTHCPKAFEIGYGIRVDEHVLVVEGKKHDPATPPEPYDPGDAHRPRRIDEVDRIIADIGVGRGALASRI